LKFKAQKKKHLSFFSPPTPHLEFNSLAFSVRLMRFTRVHKVKFVKNENQKVKDKKSSTTKVRQRKTATENRKLKVAAKKEEECWFFCSPPTPHLGLNSLAFV
jgi:hypothetical protein